MIYKATVIFLKIEHPFVFAYRNEKMIIKRAVQYPRQTEYFGSYFSGINRNLEPNHVQNCLILL